MINALYFAAASPKQSLMLMRHRILVIVAFQLVGLGVPSGSQAEVLPQAGSPYLVKVWRTGKDKLPQSSIITMIQTRDGYLWLGTVRGLVRFDGDRFEVFNEWNTPGLGGSTVVHLFEDSRGNLWVGTDPGGVRLIKDGRLIEVRFGIEGHGGRLASVCEDASGAVWLYLADGRMARVRDEKVESVWPVDSEFRIHRAVIAEPSGQLWIGSDASLARLISDVHHAPFDLLLQTVPLPGKQDFLLASRGGGYWQFANGQVLKCRTNQVERSFGAYPWGSSRIMSACEDREGNLVVGTQNGGVFWFDATGKAQRVEGLSQNTALSLCVDREGSLWVGTDGGGLNRVKRKVFSTATAARDWVVQSVCADATGGLWMGFNGGGATYWKDGVVRDFGPGDGLLGAGENRNPNFSTVLVDRQQRVWVGTRDFGLYEFVNGAFLFVSDRRLLGRNVSALYQDRTDRLWVGTDAGLACRDGGEWKTFSANEGLLAGNLTALTEGTAGVLWIGTERGGLYRMTNGKFDSLHVRDGLPSENITSLCADQDGVLWVGTGNGLARFYEGRWTHYMKKDGLASDGIGYLLDDDRGNLWIGSNAGLMSIEKSKLSDFAEGRMDFIPCRTYGEADGLPTEECTQGSQPAAYRTPDGRLWLPTIRGLVTVSPADLQPNTNRPPVVVESILVDGENQNPDRFRPGELKALTIPAGREQLDFHYASLNLAAPEQARFKYQMEGHEKDWIPAGNSRIARYPKLPPGEYRFRVTACNEDGVWNEEGASLAIVVLPAFWQTRTFRGATAACLLALVGGIVYYVSTQKLQRQVAALRQKEALERERARIARDLHDQLGANLTQVALLGELAEADKNQPQEVALYAQQISSTARETTRSLDEIVWAANPANDTLDSLITYACKYAQDYLALAGLRHRLDVPRQLPDADVPPEVRHNVFLAFKEAVNNVVKHAKASEARIGLQLNANTFTLEIEDNGQGPARENEQSARTGNGLRNMQKRMEDIHGSFSIRARTGGGMSVRLTAPLKENLKTT